MIQVRYPSDAVPMHIDDIDVEASVRLWHWIRTGVYRVGPGNVQICTVFGWGFVQVCTVWALETYGFVPFGWGLRLT